MEERGYGPDAIERGRLVLMLSVLVILLTAPVGALGIAIFGPMWLSHDVEEKEDLAAEKEAAAGAALAEAPPPAEAEAPAPASPTASPI